MSQSLAQVWVAILIIPMLVFFASMVYSVVEAIAAFRLQPWPYRRGFVVLSESRPSAVPPPFQQATRLTESGRYRMLSPDSAIFCSGRQLFGFRFNTSVPVRGTIRWADGRAEITGRMPSGAPWAWASWTLAVIAFTLVAERGPRNGPFHWWFLPVGMLFMLVTGPAFIPFEKRRAMTVATEVLSWERAAITPQSDNALAAWRKRVLWFAALFLPFWLALNAFIAIGSGWYALGQRFRATDSQRHYSQTNASIRMRKDDGAISSYGKIVRLGVDDEGIALGLPLAFQFLSPPLFIPWSAIRTCRTTHRWPTHRDVEVVLTDPPVTIEIENPSGSLSVRCGGEK